MAASTVTHNPQHATSVPVKKESRFWLRRNRPVRETEAEHDTAPRWDAPTQVIPAPRPVRAAPHLHRTSATDPDEIAIKVGALCFRVLTEKLSSTRFQELLRVHLEELDKRAGHELAAGQAMLRREGNVATAVASVAEVIEAAVKVEVATGVPASLDTDAMGTGLAALSANAYDLTEQTLRFPEPLVTDDMPDPRVTVKVQTVPATAAGSPVHVPGEDLRPALPADDEDADSGASSPLARAALPRRPDRLTAFEARLDGSGALLDGDPAQAGDLPALLPMAQESGGLWLAHRGYWHRMRTAQRRGGQVDVTLESGVTDCPDADAVVHVLHDADARTVRGQAVDA